MRKHTCSIITGTGSYIPPDRKTNEQFLDNVFYGRDGRVLEKANKEIIAKFQEITGIRERRYVAQDQTASDIAFLAAQDALGSSRVDPETLDHIIVAHNFGDVTAGNPQSGLVPTLAAKVKARLKITNPETLCYDLPFGCPGWLQGLIHADCFIKAGAAGKILVVGTETLSRVSDPHDIDSMIYADGAGAAIVEAMQSAETTGVLSHAARSDTLRHSHLLGIGKSYNPHYRRDARFLKMDGHKLYEYALRTVPGVVRQSLEKAAIPIENVSKVLLHQANEKMDEAILKRFFELYGSKTPPENIMPMTIGWLGNSSVATLPTLLDLLCKQKLNGHSIKAGQHVVFASVGAGMNTNALVYKV